MRVALILSVSLALLGFSSVRAEEPFFPRVEIPGTIQVGLQEVSKTAESVTETHYLKDTGGAAAKFKLMISFHVDSVAAGEALLTNGGALQKQTVAYSIARWTPFQRTNLFKHWASLKREAKGSMQIVTSTAADARQFGTHIELALFNNDDLEDWQALANMFDAGSEYWNLAGMDLDHVPPSVLFIPPDLIETKTVQVFQESQRDSVIYETRDDWGGKDPNGSGTWFRVSGTAAVGHATVPYTTSTDSTYTQTEILTPSGEFSQQHVSTLCAVVKETRDYLSRLCVFYTPGPGGPKIVDPQCEPPKN
ncbi:MAG: hypothetical protein V1798_04210 [Pseudomonadota bacterium]